MERKGTWRKDPRSAHFARQIIFRHVPFRSITSTAERGPRLRQAPVANIYIGLKIFCRIINWRLS